MLQFAGIIDSTSTYDSAYQLPDSTLYRFDAFLTASADTSLNSNAVAQTFITEKGTVIITPKIRKDTSAADSSSILILSFVLVLIVLSKHLFPRRFQQLFQAVAGETKLNIMLREWNPALSMPGIIFFFTYPLLFSMFLQLIAQHFMIAEALNVPAYFFWQILAITAIIILLRLAIKKSVAHLFKTHEINTRYNANMFSFYLIASLVLFLSLLAMIFQQGTISFIISISIFIIILIYSLLRGFFIGLSSSRFSVLYLFLYLCTLEIVPFLLLLKTVSLLVSGQFSLF